MKKIWLIAFFILNANVFFLMAEETALLKNLGVKIYFQDSWDKAEGFEPVIIGEKITLPFMNEIFYAQKDSFSYGLSLSSEKYIPFFPTTIKAGKLSLGGNLSKLNSPSLSSSLSPFFNASTTASSVTGSLPSASGFSKPLSIFLQQDYKNNSGNLKNPFLKASFNFAAIFPQKDFSDLFQYTFVSSLSATLKKIKGSSIQVAYTSGFFPFEENISSSWYFSKINQNYYPESLIFCQNLQAGFYRKHANLLLIASQYDSPSENFVCCFRSENKFSFDKFAFNFSAFYSPEEFLSSSEKYISDQLQIKTGFQNSFILPIVKGDFLQPLFIKTGFSFYLSEDFQNQFKTKMAGGITYSFNKIKGSLNSVLEAEILPYTVKPVAITDFSVSAGNAVSIKSIKPSLYASFSMTQSNKAWTYNEKITCKIPIKSNPAINFTNSIAFSEKQKLITKKQFSAGISADFTIKQITFAAKISADCEF